MKEKIYTIPVNEGFDALDECPFCFMQRQAERSALRYIVGPGASYMEPDVRAETDRAGFCREHMKMLFQYGNTLGSALILQTYLAGLIKEFDAQAEKPVLPRKKSLLRKKPEEPEPYWKRLEERAGGCYFCRKLEYNMQRYMETFFYLIRDEEFRAKVESGKGFCLDHAAQLLHMAQDKLPAGQSQWFYETFYGKMQENLHRIKGELDWLVAKYDYRNAGAPWGDSKDALQRTMQKLAGGYPADPPIKKD